jgi:hypothetical protein
MRIIRNKISSKMLSYVTRSQIRNGRELLVDGNLTGLIRLGIVSGLTIAWLGVSILSASAQDVLTWHYNNQRTGVQPDEDTLTTSNVKASTFGKVFSFPVAGDVLAQPLYLKQYMMSDGKLHDVLIVATEEDYVYAFDADGHNPAVGYLWRKSMLAPGETWVSYADVNHVADIEPNIGITGTPVIDRAGGTIYLVAKSKTTSGTVTFHQRLHALNIANGTEKLDGPTNIVATVPGTSYGAKTVSFSPLHDNQRSALLLAPTPSGVSGSSVFIEWASHGDLGEYNGWVIAYDASNIAKQTGAWTSTANGERGGIWMCGAGPASDNEGNIFTAVANGTFDANTGGPDYGDSALRMTMSSKGLAVADYFTPDDQKNLSAADNDMGTGGFLLLPTQSGPIPHLAVTADKSGTIYLLNTSKMGGYTTSRDSSVENFGDGGYSIHSSFAFFNNTIYMAPDNGPLEAWSFEPASGLLSTSPESKSAIDFGCSHCNPTGSTPSISADGASNGIVWAIDNTKYYYGPAVLHAYKAGNLATELYNSSQAAKNRDEAALATKFTTPTVASGRVYVGGRNAVTVYGLLN